jgi:hypothetical protein
VSRISSWGRIAVIAGWGIVSPRGSGLAAFADQLGLGVGTDSTFQIRWSHSGCDSIGRSGSDG